MTVCTFDSTKRPSRMPRSRKREWRGGLFRCFEILPSVFWLVDCLISSFDLSGVWTAQSIFHVASDDERLALFWTGSHGMVLQPFVEIARLGLVFDSGLQGEGVFGIEA